MKFEAGVPASTASTVPQCTNCVDRCRVPTSNLFSLIVIGMERLQGSKVHCPASDPKAKRVGPLARLGQLRHHAVRGRLEAASGASLRLLQPNTNTNTNTILRQQLSPRPSLCGLINPPPPPETSPQQKPTTTAIPRPKWRPPPLQQHRCSSPSPPPKPPSQPTHITTNPPLQPTAPA